MAHNFSLNASQSQAISARNSVEGEKEVFFSVLNCWLKGSRVTCPMQTHAKSHCLGNSIQDGPAIIYSYVSQSPSCKAPTYLSRVSNDIDSKDIE